MKNEKNDEQMKNPYEILNVEKNSNIEIVKKRFKKLALMYHPDKLNSNLKKKKKEKENIDFITLIWAYETILKHYEEKKEKLERYENALKIKKKDLVYMEEEEYYFYICRCGDFFLFNKNLFYYYYIIYQCETCSCSIYLAPSY